MDILALTKDFLVIGFVKAVVEPAAKAFVRRRITKHGPVWYACLDEIYPGVLTKPDATPEDLKRLFFERLEKLTGEAWKPTDKDYNLLLEGYDPRAALAKKAV
jgi:hypothetical protein